MPENLIEAEASAYLRVAQGTLTNWRALGRGPKWAKVGGRVVYRRADLDAYLAKHTHDPEAAAPRSRRRAQATASA